MTINEPSPGGRGAAYRVTSADARELSDLAPPERMDATPSKQKSLEKDPFADLDEIRNATRREAAEFSLDRVYSPCEEPSLEKKHETKEPS